MLAAARREYSQRARPLGAELVSAGKPIPRASLGSMVQTIGESLSSVQRHSYFALPKTLSLPQEKRIRVVPYNASRQEALLRFCAAARGSIYIAAEELARDVEFNAVDELYSRVGLRRTRHVWLAYSANKEEPIGAAIVYRGPLGVNFSYLENRWRLAFAPNAS